MASGSSVPHPVDGQAAHVGSVSLDTGELAIVDATYLLTDEDHAEGRTPADVATDYDGVVVLAGADGVFPVLVDYDGSGRPFQIRIDLRPRE